MPETLDLRDPRARAGREDHAFAREAAASATRQRDRDLASLLEPGLGLHVLHGRVTRQHVPVPGPAQPRFTQVPPIRPRSTMVTRAPSSAPRIAAAKAAEPPPTTRR